MNPDESVPSQSEAAAAQARYAVAMHLQANRRVGILARWLSVGAIVAAIALHSLWPLALAVGVAIVSYLVIIQSCVRVVEQAIGMPPDVKAACSRMYKTDAEFARNVDSLAPSNVRPEPDRVDGSN